MRTRPAVAVRTTEEIADALGRSTATIERGWTFARSWLYKELAEARDA
ncbi:hypothetical protein J4558_23585 [Leptolyngbya sp. 15MV]|nr:hypothetical protein J4558_23585 [Leptolyngbya sp. 15MV]